MGASVSKEKLIYNKGLISPIKDDINTIESNSTENNNKKYNNNYNDAYISIKEMILLLKPFNTISLNAYLITTNTIQNFIEIIKSLKILDLLINGDSVNLQSSEEKLRKKLNKYTLENNIKILYDYNDCLNIREKNDAKENEFIIVDELFCRTMNINDYYDEDKKIKINIDRKNSKYEIILKNKKIFDFEEKTIGFYKFTKAKKASKEINNLMNDDPDITYKNRSQLID
jgi:hypothetical protein